MRPVLFSRVVRWAILLALAAGCGQQADDRSAPDGAPAVDSRELPELGDYLPPLDDDRLEVAPPQGWHVPSASSKYVVRVQKSVRDSYPSMIVTAEDRGGQGVRDVSEENVRQFAAQVAEAVNKKASAVQPRKIGSFVGVAYAKRAKVRQPVTRILDVLYLETVVAGRKYRFELRSEEGSLDEDRPYLYAFVGGTRFLDATSPPEEEAPPQPETEPEKEDTQDQVPDQAKRAGPKPDTEQQPEQKAKPEAAEKTDEDDGVELDLDKLDELIK
jgi:hypothetical protein